MTAMPAPEVPAFEALLDYLKRTRGFDFTAYKRSTLMRRIQKRMQTVGIREFTDYLDYLEVHPEEFVQLFNTILINVTGFLRDPEAWAYLADEILPRLLEPKRGDEPIRAWSAGCASGEEAYTLAMLLAEDLGIDAFRKRVKIYGTDVDEEALNQARQATYAAKDLEAIPPPLLERYFERVGSQYVFHRDLRRSVIFGRNDLVQDSPISRVDLLVSRNTLMYFNGESQARILARFHFALNPNGFLFLGKAEMLLTHTDLFTPVDLRRRVFVKVPHEGRARPLRMLEAGRDEAANNVFDARMRELTFETDPHPQILLDGSGAVAMANERARSLFGISLSDSGRPFQDLDISHRPADLRSVTDQALREHRPVLLREVPWHTSAGETKALDIQTMPLFDGGELLGVRLTFTDVTRYRRLQDELTQSKQELETAYEELQSSNEELETTNEELQSSNEELETTNEELQSTNEELETMNEELQSTNEELETINSELRQRSEELNRTNAFMSSVLGGLRAGVAVLDRDLQVLVWTDRAEDLWGLRAHEVQGRHFLNLDIGLPVAQLLPMIRACLTGEPGQSPVTVDATNRRGRPVRCTVACTSLLGPDGKSQGAIVLMEAREDGA